MGGTIEFAVTIENGETTTGAFRVTDGLVTGFVMPAAFTGSTLAIHACGTAGGTFVPIYDSDGNAVSLAVAASRAVGLSGAEADAVSAFPFIRLVSGSSEGAAREITVIQRM